MHYKYNYLNNSYVWGSVGISIDELFKNFFVQETRV